MSTFTCLSLTPIELEHPGIAVATVRAGGVGVLDLEYCSKEKLELAKVNLKLFLKSVDNSSTVGLRLKMEQVATSVELINALCNQPYVLIISQWEPQSLLEGIASLPKAISRQILLEVTNAQQTLNLELIEAKIHGLVARGQESGGWIGEDPAFILTQKLLKCQSLPVYIQGGIGIHTAAACRGVGAAGVILDDQLWLMKESPLPPQWQSHLRNLSGQEAIVIGERLGKAVRVLSRPGFQVITHLQQLAQKLETQTDGETKSWQLETDKLIGWGTPGSQAWPIGQGVGLAVPMSARYRTTGRLVQAILRATQEQITTAEILKPLQAGSALAQSHHTKYPLVQGPMTRVSDSAQFADAVAQTGAVPMLALALMKKSQVQTLLEQVQKLIGNRSWGVGILGFVPQSLREQQLEVIRAVKPPFALIAGGRPDQAAKLEAEGIATYIHVPTPGLLSLFLEQGGKKFIFEGRECGGHVGPLSSFVLWESAINILLTKVPVGEAQQIHILFAGGIHDALSAAMVSVMAAPLAAQGMKIGVLMGSAYLFTEEAVKCGAIVDGFQQQALACDRTINLETGPGHASRCAVTPFAEEFYNTRKRMLTAGNSATEITKALEDLSLGRLRVASKGLVRNGAEINSVEPERQQTDGMYMIGQVATMRHQLTTVEQLHEDVCQGSGELLTKQALEISNQELPETDSKPSDIAIIGMGTLLPKAQSPETFWENIIGKVNGITEIPAHRWDWRLYYDPNPQAKDKVNSKWGGFLDDVPFDPLRFGIPPKSLKSIEPVQLMTLETVRRALADAGYENGDFDRENTSVILGASGGMSDLGQQYATRSELPRMVNNPDPDAWERLPEWTEESFPGLLMNVTAGRIANRFDLGGANFTVDAACASSLAALDLAVAQLESGRCNLAIAGGFDAVQSAFAYFCFSKTQALSSQGIARSFDRDADGIVISEGIATVVLKRLEDAQKDGDRIYAVIKAVASSSDGRGLSMTAPASSGQQVALKRAYQKAGFSPSTIGLYEAHGTGTVAGDRTELETISSLLTENKAEAKSCVLGSVKTMIGHTKSTAGIAALVKATLSLHHQILPPHTNVERPLEALDLQESPLYLLKEAQPWLSHSQYPRRAGVSAFGFGGTNFHAVLEEYQGNIATENLGAQAWPYELLVFAATEQENLIAEITKLQENLQQGAKPRLRDLAYTYALKNTPLALNKLFAEMGNRESELTKTTSKKGFDKNDDGFPCHCLSVVTESLSQLQESLELAITHLQGKLSTPLPSHIQISHLEADSTPSSVAFLFPGQGAQYPHMAREIGLYFPEMRHSLEFADRYFKDKFDQPLSKFIQPPSAYSESQEQLAKQQLTHTQIAQPAIGTVETGYLDLITRLGLKADFVAGHSYGEYAALHAAGVLSRQEFLNLSEIRGRVMSSACQGTEGAMAAVQMTKTELLSRLQGRKDVVLANHNSPLQSVISGTKSAVQQLVEELEAVEIRAKILPVAGAFHSSLIESAQEALGAAIATANMQNPQIPVYSNTTAQPYEHNVASIRNQLSQHLLSSVEFVSQIEAIYHAGAHTFIEIGPKSILTKLVGQILTDQPHHAIALDGNGGGMKGFLIALGTLFNQGLNFNLTALYKGRDVQQLNLNQLLPLTKETPLSPTAWLVNGGSARPQNEAVGYTGTKPPLTLAVKQSLENQQVKENSTQHQSYSSFPPQFTPPPKMPNGHPESNGASQKINAQHNQPQIPLPIVNGSNSPSPAALSAYQAYQQTMRQFLSLQEQVMKQFLSGSVSKMADYPSIAPIINNHTYTSIPKPQPPAVNTNSNSKGNNHTNGINEAVRENIISSNSVASSPTPIVNQSINRDLLIETLLALVSERTGYPPDMLGLDQDLEADLGIDSIKRVEIFGALQKTLNEPLASTLKAQMDSFTQVKTLNGLVDKLLNNRLLTEVSEQKTVSEKYFFQESNQLLEENSSTSNLQINRDSLIETLLALVSDRTGYPRDMLGLDQDLEADLGIDSIKRVEIFGALQKSTNEPLASTLKAQMDSFTQVKTLNGLVDKLLVSSQSNHDERVSSLGKSEDVVAAQRYVMEGQLKPLKNLISDTASLTGLFLITEDLNQSVGEKISTLLQTQGIKAAVIDQTSLQQREALIQKVNTLRQQYGQVQGIIHAAGYGTIAMPQKLGQWQNLAHIQSKSLFNLLQICADDLRQFPGQVIAISSLGGHFGRNGNLSSSSPLAGSSNGLLKTMMLEWSGVRGKAIDFDSVSDPEIASIIFQELVTDDNSSEIGYCQNQRLVFEPVLTEFTNKELELLLEPIRPAQDWVVLSIGGARGITAEVTREILVPGMKLILVGRSPEPKAESSLTNGIEDVGILRKLLVQQAQQQGRKPTPAQIERQINQIKRDHNLRLNLAQLRNSGVIVEYHSLDVRNEVEFGSLINSIYQRFGRLDAVIQGAGIIQDKLLVDKTPKSFDQVFNTKVDSTFILSRYLRPDNLKLMIIFASVSGRTGNRGQGDYAAANEVLNRFAWWMHQQWRHTRVIAINWGPWDVTGMASESVNRQFRERGVIPIPPAAGRQFVTEELLYGDHQNVELIAGIFETVTGQPKRGRGAGKIKHLSANSNQQVNLNSGKNLSFPLLPSLPEIQSDSTVTITKTITLESDYYLRDHRLDGKPVLPAAGALEYMAQLVQAAWPEWTVAEVHNLRVWRGIVLETEAGKQITLKARAASHADAESISVVAEIIDAQSNTPSYRATFILRQHLETAPLANIPHLNTTSGLDVQAAYRQYCFHGELFQLLNSIERFNEQGITAHVTPSDPNVWLNLSITNNSPSSPNWLFDPGLIDSSLQMALMWTHIQGDTGALPSQFGKVVRYGNFWAEQNLRIELRVKEFTATSMIFDAIFVDTNNCILLWLIDMENTCSKALNRLATQ